MTTLRQAAQQALEALEAITRSVQSDHQAEIAEDAITALRTALAMHQVSEFAQAQEQAEPTCPSCKAAVLYECVACSSNNYPPQQKAEPPPEWPLIKNILAEYGLDAISFVAEWKAAQRPWVDLTDGDWEWVADKKETSLDTFAHGAAWAADQLKEKNT